MVYTHCSVEENYSSILFVLFVGWLQGLFYNSNIVDSALYTLPFFPSKEKTNETNRVNLSFVVIQSAYRLYVNSEKKLLENEKKKRLVRLWSHHDYFFSLFSGIGNTEIGELSYLIVSAREQKKVEARKWLS